MKRKITKAEYDALADNMKVLYVPSDGDTYILPLTDYAVSYTHLTLPTILRV